MRRFTENLLTSTFHVDYTAYASDTYLFMHNNHHTFIDGFSMSSQ